MVETSESFSSWRWTLLHVRFWRAYRLTGRFRTWRRALRVIGRTTQGWRRTASWLRHETVFTTLSAAEVARNLRQHGYHAGLQLPARLVTALRNHAERTPCWRTLGDLERFFFHDIRRGRTPLGHVVAVADLDALTCPETAMIAGDAALIDAVKCHLGYRPSRVATRLYWSLACDLTPGERRWSGQTIDYHYDIEPANTVYLYFYLTDTDRDSGAHVIVPGSHRWKPWRLLLTSTRRPDPLVVGYYGADTVVVLEGKAGFGFFEDPACFHKVLPPRSSSRLMLQFRYS